jgi:hypothetical protein
MIWTDTRSTVFFVVVANGESFQVTQALAATQDSEHLQKQQIPDRNPYPAPHPDIRDRFEVADQIEIGGGENTVEQNEEAFPPTSTLADSNDKQLSPPG